MTKEDKELLFRDLCARVPYGVKVQYMNNIFVIDYVSPMYGEVKLDISDNWTVGVSEVKPYLFPLSSITKKRLEELSEYIDIKNAYVAVELLNSHHIDYRGLIEKGLAIDATELNIYC